MNIPSSTQRVESTPARTTKPASATGKPKNAEKPDAAAINREQEKKRADDPVAQKLKKMQTVDVQA